jgi:Methyladenine glycosylase
MPDKPRCRWVNLKNPVYIKYHDEEWGRELHDDQKLFELLCLEGAQAGVAWEMVLNKREEYRACFWDFDVDILITKTDDELVNFGNEHYSKDLAQGDIFTCIFDAQFDTITLFENNLGISKSEEGLMKLIGIFDKILSLQEQISLVFLEPKVAVYLSNIPSEIFFTHKAVSS